MQTIYRTKAIRLDSGERFPLLVECDTELGCNDALSTTGEQGGSEGGPLLHHARQWRSEKHRG